MDYGTNVSEPVYRSSYKPKPIRHMAASEDLTGRRWFVGFFTGWLAAMLGCVTVIVIAVNVR